MREDEVLRYAERLQKMIRCRTVSVKDTYRDEEFAKLRGVMEELFPIVHTKAERHRFSDDCWIFRIAGKDRNRNIMLMSHHDVVDAEEDKWSHSPFGAEIAEGKLWGRGAVDTKTPLFAEFSALEELLCGGWEPPCNIWIGSSHNEELGGDGIPTALQWFRERKITFDAILDEGGAIIDPPMSGMKVEKCAMVAVHEKGRYRLTLTADGANAHAGLTAAAAATPIERMSTLIRIVTEGKIFIRRLNPQLRAMFTALAPYCGFPLKPVLKHLGLTGALLRKVLPKLNPQAGGLMGTTCIISRVEGDGKKCTASASFRAVDGEDLEKDLESLRKEAEKLGITVTVESDSEYHAPADLNRPMFGYMTSVIRKVFPQYPPVPFILPAGTDARTLTEICPCVLRFAPIRLSAQQLASVHSEDENIDLDAIADAVTFYREFLSGLSNES